MIRQLAQRNICSKQDLYHICNSFIEFAKQVGQTIGNFCRSAPQLTSRSVSCVYVTYLQFFVLQNDLALN